MNQTAIIAAGDTATVTFQDFNTNLGTLEYTTDQSAADVTVTVYASDGTIKEFYFEQTAT
jgi:hypothetical protein